MRLLYFLTLEKKNTAARIFNKYSSAPKDFRNFSTKALYPIVQLFLHIHANLFFFLLCKDLILNYSWPFNSCTVESLDDQCTMSSWNNSETRQDLNKQMHRLNCSICWMWILRNLSATFLPAGDVSIIWSLVLNSLKWDHWLNSKYYSHQLVP